MLLHPVRGRVQVRRLLAQASQRPNDPSPEQVRPRGRKGGRDCFRFHWRCAFALGSSRSTTSRNRGYPLDMSWSCRVVPWCEEDTEVEGTSNLRLGRLRWSAVHPTIPAASRRQAGMARWYDRPYVRGEERRDKALPLRRTQCEDPRNSTSGWGPWGVRTLFPSTIHPSAMRPPSLLSDWHRSIAAAGGG